VSRAAVTPALPPHRGSPPTGRPPNLAQFDFIQAAYAIAAQGEPFMEQYDRERVIERVGPSGMAEPVALTVHDDDPEPGWSVFILQHGRVADSVRHGFITREFGKYYARSCDIYGRPEYPLIRLKVMYGEGNPAFESFLQALTEFLGHRPNTRLRYARS
jgi:hypothetical protein